MRAPGTRLRAEQAGDRLTGRFRVVRAAGGGIDLEAVPLAVGRAAQVDARQRELGQRGERMAARDDVGRQVGRAQQRLVAVAPGAPRRVTW
jgi:hypothetical protein